MTEIQLTNFSFGGESPDRSRFHLAALRDARIATDRREGLPEANTRPGLLARLGLGSRLRVAFAGGPATTESCNCPA